jgi:parvulin-like peptidyl-prolyl isomerase/predicted small lipoprotein YifL
MVDRTSLRSLTAAISFLAVAGCGRSTDGGALTPVPPAQVSPAATASSTSTPSTHAPVPGDNSKFPSAVPPGVDAQRPVATVNGKPISAAKVYSVYRMNQQMIQQRGRVLSASDEQFVRSQSLGVVVAEELLYQAALAKGIQASPVEVDAAVKELKARVGSEEKYKQFLAQAGLTDTEVRHEIARNIRTEAYSKGLVAGKGVGAEQARKFYDANVSKGMFNAPEQVHVQYILVKASEKDPESVRLEARKRAEEAAKRAAAGEDFSALAKQYSQDSTAARGGDIGFIERGMMFPKFEEVAFAAKPGEVTPLFETPKGFNVMKVLEKKPGSTRSFEDVKNELMIELNREVEQRTLKAKVKELTAGAKIEILDPAFAVSSPVSVPAVAAKP